MTNESDRGQRPASEVGKELAARVLAERKLAESQREQVVASHLGAAASPGNNVGILVAEGDSWFHYPKQDILKVLDDSYGYQIESVAHRGDCVEEMAYEEGQLSEFTRMLQKILRSGKKPDAILLSGGGNDIAGDEFAIMLNHAASGMPSINAQIAAGVIEARIANAYATLLTAVTKICEDLIGKRIRVVLHGYDYPVPDGRGYGIGPLPGPWLDPGFRKKGYPDVTPEDRQQRIKLISTLIDQFNETIKKMVAEPEFQHVKFVDLRRTLSAEPKEYKEWWDNELHPTNKGFARITAKIVEAITASD